MELCQEISEKINTAARHIPELTTPIRMKRKHKEDLENNEMKQQLEQAQAESKQLISELAVARAALGKPFELENIREQKRKQEEDVKEWTYAVVELSDFVAQYEHDINEIRNSIEHLRKLKDENEVKYNVLDAQIYALIRQIGEANLEGAELKANTKAITEEIDIRGEEADKYLVIVHKSEKDIASQLKTLNAKTKELQLIKKRLNRATEHLEQLEWHGVDLDQQEAAIQQQVQTMKNDNPQKRIKDISFRLDQLRPIIDRAAAREQMRIDEERKARGGPQCTSDSIDIIMQTPLVFDEPPEDGELITIITDAQRPNLRQCYIRDQLINSFEHSIQLYEWSQHALDRTDNSAGVLPGEPFVQRVYRLPQQNIMISENGYNQLKSNPNKNFILQPLGIRIIGASAHTQSAVWDREALIHNVLSISL
jgi:hypothetical protein